MSQTLGANFTGNMQMAQNQWNQQFANPVSNPTNPNPYDFNWDSQTINPYIQGGGDITNPYQYGGNQRSFLQDQGIYVQGLTDEELAFLPSMDRLNTAYDRMNTNVGMARTGLGFNMDAQQLAGQQNLLNMTGGQGLASVGGFGGRSSANMMSNVANQGQAYRSGLNQQMAGFQSDILGMQYDFQDAQSNYQDALTTALGNIAASGETDLEVSTNAGAFVDESSNTDFAPPAGSSIYNYNGNEYGNINGQWKPKREWLSALENHPLTQPPTNASPEFVYQQLTGG